MQIFTEQTEINKPTRPRCIAQLVLLLKSDVISAFKDISKTTILKMKERQIRRNDFLEFISFI